MLDYAQAIAQTHTQKETNMSNVTARGGDTPGHPFRGNQYTQQQEDDMKEMVHDAFDDLSQDGKSVSDQEVHQHIKDNFGKHVPVGVIQKHLVAKRVESVVRRNKK